MSAKDDRPGKKGPRSTLPKKKPWSLGIEARLAISFAAVAVLAIAANLIAEHGVAIIETTRFASRPAVPATVVARPVPQIVLPVPEAPSPSPPPAQPLVDVAPVVMALDQADRAFHARLELDDPVRRAELDRALGELTRLTTSFPWARAGIESANARNQAVQLVRGYAKQGTTAVQLADARRTYLEAYRQKLASLEATLAQAIDKGWKVFGRLVARQSLINLSRGLQSIENSSVALGAAGYQDASAVQDLLASEEVFAAELAKSRDNLRRTQGVEWDEQLAAGFDRLVASRIDAMAADSKLLQTVAQLARERSRIVEMARANVRALAVAAPAPAPVPAVVSPPVTPEVTPLPAASALRTEELERSVVERKVAPEGIQARNWVVWITVVVLVLLLAISISTILSIVRPVRQLIQATRRISAGAEAKVARGGIKELDDLAVAFNEMAGHLVAARATVAAHQETLEKRVRERTHALQHLAEHDSLTQLPNRRLLLDRLNDALDRARGTGARVAVYFIDLDNFKNINDGTGHDFGDLVLLSVAQRLSETAAAYGLAARLGGDEFTILYPDAPSEQAIAEFGSIILRAFQRPLVVGDRELTISASVGASIFPDHAQHAETLLRAADAALFRAKALGRSQLHLFSPDLVEAAHSKFVVEQGLRRALEQNEFELVYQPEMDLKTMEPALVEALLRWRTPDGRLLSPDAFLGVAEECGLMMDLSDWVLRTAIAAAASWHHGAWPQVRVAINVSPRQLFDARFVDRVEDLLREHDLPPHCIEIELTENVLQTGANTIDALRRLRARGIAIALDDFGTGYSSFASLEVLPLTRVKLDRSLIESIDSSPQSWAIASSIIGLCRKLEFQITAEGVERPEQLAMLMEQGATHIQGFLLARPVARDDLPAELAALPDRLESLLLTLPVPASARHCKLAEAWVPEGARKNGGH